MTAPPDRRRAAFTRALCAEHLDEAGFLYTLLVLPAGRASLALEGRMDGYIDALRCGTDAAVAACDAALAGDDAGELHVALRVHCRRGTLQAALEVVSGLPFTPERDTAVTTALCLEPAAHRPELVTALFEGGECLRSAGARLVGYLRRGPVGRLSVLARGGELEAASAAWAAGRLGLERALPALARLMVEGAPRAAAAAAEARLRLGDRTCAGDLAKAVPEAPWAIVPLALAGGQVAARALLDLADPAACCPDLVEGLGVLGRPAGLRVLIPLLDDRDVADAAALAIERITGVRLEPSDGDERPAGSAPGLPDGAWESWCRARGLRLDPGIEYHGGVPADPPALASTLTEGRARNDTRQLAHAALAIRHGVRTPYESFMPESLRAAAAEACRRWAVSPHCSDAPRKPLYPPSPLHGGSPWRFPRS